jgi:hypothetical protein
VLSAVWLSFAVGIASISNEPMAGNKTPAV